MRRLGVAVARPLSDERYDLIFDLGSRLVRVQCKWADGTDDVITVRCRTSRRGPNGHIHRSYKPGEIDALAAYSPRTGRCYLLPTDLSVGRAAVQLRLGPTRNGQNVGIRWAKDYEIAARLRHLQGP